MIKVDVELTGLVAKIKSGLIDHLLECTYLEDIYVKSKGKATTRTVTNSLRLYDIRGGFTYIGLGALLFLARNNALVQLNLTAVAPPRRNLSLIILPPKITNSPKWLVNGKERFYFHEALKVCQNISTGFIKLSTGSGKSSIMLTLAYNQLREIGTGVILVPTNAIKDQFLRSATDFGVDIIEYGVSRTLEENKIYITTPLILLNDIGKIDDTSTIPIKWIIADEAHHFSCDSWSTLLKRLPNLIRSHGFSALPIVDETKGSISFDKIDVRDALNISITGPVIYEKSAYDLRDFLNIPLLINYKFKWKPNAYEGQYSRNWHEVRGCISRNEDRKDELVGIIKLAINLGYKLIMHVDTRTYGEDIISRCFDDRVIGWYGGNYVFTHKGTTTIEDLRANFGSTYKALIGTQHLSEGLDMDSPLNFLALASGKSVRQTVQKSGRIVRPDDCQSIVLNFNDEGIFILPRQAEERSNVVIAEFQSRSVNVSSLHELESVLKELEDECNIS